MLSTTALIILALLLSETLLMQVATWLNLGALGARPPAPLSDLFEPEEYERSMRYTREKERLSMWIGLLRLAALIAFWGLGGFGWLDLWLRAWSLPEAVTGTLFFGALMAGQSLLSLPFAIHVTFGVEARYGFNRTSARTFVSDRLKGAALGVLLGGPLCAGLLWVLQWAGPLGWLYGWAGLTLVSFAVQYVAPTWLMPLFMKFSPLEDEQLTRRLFSYAERTGFPLQGIFVVDGSRRSSKANAFFTGFGKRKRIALFDTLLDSLDTDEVVAVLAHEIGHHKRGHIWRGMVSGVLQTFLSFALLGLCLGYPDLPTALGITTASVYASMLVFALLYTPLEVAIGLFSMWRSRVHEFEADDFAAETTGQPMALVGGLRKLARGTLSNLTPHPFYVWLHYTHPPLGARIGALQALSADRVSSEPSPG